VLQQALILAVLGYFPGLLVTIWLYRMAGAATHLPLEITTGRAVGVLALTATMCLVSGLLALRKVRALDPAEIFCWKQRPSPPARSTTSTALASCASRSSTTSTSRYAPARS